jgi:type II secretory pathway pseudopilin PulG
LIDKLRVFFDVDWLCNRMIRAKHTLMVCVRRNEIKSQYTQKRRSKGLSIIEISIFITILIVVVYFSLSAYREYGAKTQKAALSSSLHTIREALSDYVKDNGTYPNTLNGLISAGSGTFRYLSQIPIDPTTGVADWEIKKGTSTEPSYLSGMVAYYPFREGIGDTTRDVCGNNPIAKIYGGALWTSGYSDECILFDGSDDYIYLDDESTNANNTFDSVIKERSISVYFYATSLNGIVKMIYEEGGATNGMNIYIKNGVLYCGAWSEDYGWNGAWLSIATNANTWHQVVLVFDLDNSLMNMYYDGNFVSNSSISVGIAEHTGDDALGAIVDDSKLATGDVVGGPKDYFSGKIDELRVYDRALSTSEVSQLYNRPALYTWIERSQDESTSGEVLDVRSNNPDYKDW